MQKSKPRKLHTDSSLTLQRDGQLCNFATDCCTAATSLLLLILRLYIVEARMSTPLDRFVAAATTGDEVFIISSRTFRSAIAKEESQHNKRLETPSAHLATSQAAETRKRFERDVVEADGNAEQKRLWSELSVDERDEFICRIFMPTILGGFFDDD